MRKLVGRYGLTGRQQTCPIRQLSDGQRCRLVFAHLAFQTPHLLLLDEPSNGLGELNLTIFMVIFIDFFVDMETIDALADAINEFEGGVVLVSHDFRLIDQVVEDIWICEHGTVTKWDGSILDYKEKLKKIILKEEKKAK